MVIPMIQSKPLFLELTEEERGEVRLEVILAPDGMQGEEGI